MTVLNYAHHQNVNGGIDTLDKVRTFAVAQGWTQEQWIDGYRWDTSSPFGFTVADANAGLLELSSNGYGSQTLECRMQIVYSSGRGVYYLNMGMTDGTHWTDQQYPEPWAQNNKTYRLSESDGYTTEPAMHIGTATYDDLWIFGDDKWICAVLSMDGVYVQYFHFGSMHMFEDTPTQGDCRGMTMHTLYNTDHEWYRWDDLNASLNKCTTLPAWWPGFRSMDGAGWVHWAVFDFYWDSSSAIGDSGSTYIVGNIFPYDDYGDADQTYLRAGLGIGATNGGYNYPFMNLGECLQNNVYSNKRVMMRQVYTARRSSDGLWVPVCKTPCYFLNPAGLSIGETLTYGSEQFMCFPIGPYYSEIGVAFQIA